MMTQEELLLFVFILYRDYGFLINNGLRAAASIVAEKILLDYRNLTEIKQNLQALPWNQLNAAYVTQNNSKIMLDGAILQNDIMNGLRRKFFENKYFTKYFTTLQSIYNNGYAFPTWSIEFLRTNLELFHTVVVFYNDGDNKEDVSKVFREREPTNIGMRRPYDPQKLESTFGHAHGAYQESCPGKLMPNIAVKCQTPVKIPSSGDIILVWVINLIGAAFDCPQQPDYQHFCRNEVDNSSVVHLLKPFCKNVNLEELKTFYYKVWLKAFEAVHQDPRLTTLKVAGVGSNNFSPFYQEQDFMNQIQNPIIDKLKLRFPDVTVETLNYFIPQGFSTETSEKLQKTLFVNAWDPWSMAGNGNSKDNSLDGYWGRSSCIGVLCHHNGVTQVNKIGV
jgi:hypothetical protein